MSAKVNCLVSIRMKSSEHSKTLQLCSEESVYGWKRLYAKRLDNVTYRVLHESSGCNTSERTGSLVKSNEMGEPLFHRRSQNAMLGAEISGMVHLRGVSGDMSRQRQDGTWETLANCTGSEPEQKDFSYKETKWKSVGRESDEAILCAGQRSDQEGSSPSGARMRSTISESGSEISLADEKGTSEGRVSIVRWNPKGMRRNTGPQSKWSTHR